MIEGQLADFVSATRWDDLSGASRQRVGDLLLDAIACAFTGHEASTRPAFARIAHELGGDGDYVIINDAPAGLSSAVLINAWQTTATTMCDVYRPAMCHVTPIVLSAALAAAHGVSPSHADFMVSFALGAEVTVRLCSAMDPGLYQGARWHAPGVIGPFGSATTVSRMHGTGPGELLRAWGLAGLQSSGTFSAIGSSGVKFTQARAALAGVTAARFSAAGLGGNPVSLSHPDGGLFDAYGGAKPGLAVLGLGSEWRLQDISLRRWPAASSLQSLVECILRLRESPMVPQSLDIALPPQSFKLCAQMGWSEQLEALQSARWVAAVVWADGGCWLDQFSPARLADAALGEWAATVTVREDARLPAGAAHVNAVLDDGTEITEEIMIALGSPDRALSRQDVLEKLGRAAGEPRAARIAALIDGVDWSFDALAASLAGNG